MDDDTKLEPLDSINSVSDFQIDKQPVLAERKNQHIVLIIVVLATVLVCLSALLFFVSNQKTAAENQYVTATFENKYYRFDYPADWQVHERKGYDISFDGVVLLSPEAAEAMDLSTTSPINWSKSLRELRELGLPHINIQSVSPYLSYIPLEERKDFFLSIMDENWEYYNEDLQQEAVEISILGTQTEPVFMSLVKENNNFVQGASWFAKADKFGRDKGHGAILVSLEYTANEIFYDSQIFDIIFNSVEDTIYEHLLADSPVPERRKNISGILDYETVFVSDSIYFLEMSVSETGKWALLNSFSEEDFTSQNLYALNVDTLVLQPINLEPFSDMFDLMLGDIETNQIFSPSGNRIALPASVGIAAQNNELAGFEGFVVYDLNGNESPILLPTENYKYSRLFLRPVNNSESVISLDTVRYRNLFGWLSESELVYVCNNTGRHSISFDEASYCLINLDTKEISTLDNWDVITTTYSNKMKKIVNSTTFESENTECVYLSLGYCLRVIDGLITLERGDKNLKLLDTNTNSFYGWIRGNDVFVIISEGTWKGFKSQLVRFNLTP